MWGGSKVPPSKPLRTSPRIGTGEVAIDAASPGGAAAGRWQEIKAARIPRSAHEVRERICVFTIHPNRPMQHGLPMSQPGLPHPFSGRHAGSDINEDLG
jgi:hypothetical protein